MMGTPKSLWPVNPIASGTDEASTNSMYAMPFDLLEFLSEIILTSLTYRDKWMICLITSTRRTITWETITITWEMN